jgi:amino acid transporter
MNPFHILIAKAFAAVTPDDDTIIPHAPPNIPTAPTGLGGLAGDVINILFGVAGGITLIVIIYLGYQMLTSKGKDEEFKKALQGMSYAALGLTILGLAYAVVLAFLNYIT